MTDDDSFDDEPVSSNEMIKLGLDSGATHLFICCDEQGCDSSYAYPGDCWGTIEKRCWGGSLSVETIDLDEIRKRDAFI